MPSPKRQPPKPAVIRKSSSARKSTSGKPASGKPAAGKRSGRKTTGGGVLAKIPTRTWSWNRLSIDRKLDIVGVILALAGLLTLLSLFSPAHGSLTGWWVLFVNQVAGMGAFILPVALILMGVWLVLRNVERLPMLSAERLTGVVLMYLNILAWLHLLSGGGWALAKAGQGGGYIGGLFEQLTVGALGQAGAVVAFSAWLLIAVALTLDISVSEIFHFIQMALASLARRVNERLSVERQVQLAQTARSNGASVSGLPSSPASPDYYVPELDNSGRPRQPEPAVSSDLPPGFNPLNTVDPRPGAPSAGPDSVRPTRTRPSTGGASAEAAASAQAAANPPKPAGSVPTAAQKTTPLPPWKLPDISDILDPGAIETVKSGQDKERADVIEETLASFGAPVKVVEIQRGPTVTQFGVEPFVY